MGFMNKLLGERGSRKTDDYLELNIDDFEAAAGDAKMRVHIAKIGNQQDVIAIKDAIYDGDLVIADITRHATEDRTMQRISDELQQVAQEVGGDIVQKDDDQLILTPTGVSISRQKLGGR
ncbi:MULTISPECIES: cell division protein SepF [unclassified Haladaptatus]|uniref:cell division protein SepF n=1 Tax=unclassified Haladaptatus TaxID=2622732 RepID=UPI002FCE2260